MAQCKSENPPGAPAPLYLQTTSMLSFWRRNFMQSLKHVAVFCNIITQASPQTYVHTHTGAIVTQNLDSDT